MAQKDIVCLMAIAWEVELEVGLQLGLGLGLDHLLQSLSIEIFKRALFSAALSSVPD